LFNCPKGQFYLPNEIFVKDAIDMEIAF